MALPYSEMSDQRLSFSSDSAVVFQPIALSTPGFKSVEPLPTNLLRLLTDKSTEKRKAGATELQALIKAEADASNSVLITGQIAFCKQELVDSHTDSSRKGGLLAFSAIAVGISGNTSCSALFQHLLKPVVTCFRDIDPRIRYSAVESMYNISRVCRQQVLHNFNDIFRGMIELFADVDNEVRRAAQQLDSILKSIVVETEADKDHFDSLSFMEMTYEMIRTVRNPSVQQMLVSWLSALDSIPSFDLLQYLPKFLEGLFCMLSSQSKDVKHSVYNSLKDFLDNVKEKIPEKKVDMSSIISTLVSLCGNSDTFVRSVALNWIYELLNVAGIELVQQYSNMLRAIVRCLSDKERDIVEMAGKTNQHLLLYVENICKYDSVNTLNFQDIMSVLMDYIDDESNTTREAVMDWVLRLQTYSPSAINNSLESILVTLTARLSDPQETVIQQTLRVLCMVSKYEGYFSKVIKAVVTMFQGKDTAMESSGKQIIIMLCEKLGTEQVYVTFAEILHSHANLPFTRKLIELLDLILLTEAALEPIRERLKCCFENDDADYKSFFQSLFKTWCLNPASSLNLCLLVQAYKLAYDILILLSKTPMTVEIISQLARLVQLLESPIFTHLRMQVLEHSKHPYLLRALYGLLMMLPQSRAYTTLDNRLRAVAMMQQVNYTPEEETQCHEKYPNYAGLVERFRQVVSRPKPD